MKTLFFALAVFLSGLISCFANPDEVDWAFTKIPWQPVNLGDIAGANVAKKIVSVDAFYKAMTSAPDDSMTTLVAVCGSPDAEYNPTRSTSPSQDVKTYDGGLIFRYDFPNEGHLYIWTGKKKRINEAWLWDERKGHDVVWIK